MCERPPRPGGRLRSSRTRRSGGSTFAEDPATDAFRAHIIWDADLDPGTLCVTAEPAEQTGQDSFDPERLARWLHVVVDAGGREHAVMSDGTRRIRLDVEVGSLRDRHPVRLHYRLSGVATVAPKLLSLRRLISLVQRNRFPRSLFPADRRVRRFVEVLRVHDALDQGASQREIGLILFGGDRREMSWPGPGDSVRSRVRRLVSDARAMAQGGYRSLLRIGPGPD